MMPPSTLQHNNKLFLCKDGVEILWVSLHIVTILLFWVDVLLSNLIIRFGPQVTRVEMNCKVELREKLRPPSLSAGQHLSSGEILNIVVVSDHIHKGSGALKVVTPLAEHLEDGEQLLIVGVVVQLHRGQHVGVECHGAYLII